MGTGDIPAQGNYLAANATWVFDDNYGGLRPATRTPYVAWPPAGYVPAPVVFPRWSFSLPNAVFDLTSVTLRSNGVPVAVVLEAVSPLLIGENTLVWYPAALDPNSEFTVWPFSGNDTVYSVTVSNVFVPGQGMQHFGYNVTVFDPARPGPDTVTTVVSGTNQPTVNADNLYTIPPVTDPNLTGYEWLLCQTNAGFFIDGATNGLTNFIVTVSPGYPVVTNSSASGQVGTQCFHLAMPLAEDQSLQINRRFLPQTNTAVHFRSLLGYATTNQIARVQVTTNDGLYWQNLYNQPGTGGEGETVFSNRWLSLSSYAGMPVCLRFQYDYEDGPGNTRFSQILTNPPVGWFLDNITVSNTLALVALATNAVGGTNFFFAPPQRTNYQLQARAVIFNDFPLEWGPLKLVNAITSPPVVVLARPVRNASQLQLGFNVSGGPASGFHLLQSASLPGTWVTNAAATLTTNVANRAFTFTTTNGPGNRFYRVQAR
jgi:hypothetical protein